MPRKVEPPHRGQGARVVVTPRHGTDWIDRERIAEIAKRHGICDCYDLYTALDHAITWYLMDASRQHDAPTREQLRQSYQQGYEHAAGLEAWVSNLPFGEFAKITEHAPNGGWKSRLLDELRTLQAAVARLRHEANKPAKREPDRARQNFAKSLIRAYEEGTGRKAKAPHWNESKECRKGAILSFALDCLALIPQNESGTNPYPFVSDQALAELLRKIIVG